MLFVEGQANSLDAPLYSILFPATSIIPKESCRDVESAVRGLRGADDLHWISAWGVVDNDQRSEADIGRLRKAGVWALSHYSVEALYYHSSVVQQIAERQAAVTGHTAKSLVDAAIDRAVLSVKNSREHFVASTVLRGARMRLMASLPTRESEVKDAPSLSVEVDISALRTEEEKRFDQLVDNKDWNGLLTRYPLRESAAFKGVAAGLKMDSVTTYQSAVLKLLQEDAPTLQAIRDMFSDLHSEVSKT